MTKKHDFSEQLLDHIIDKTGVIEFLENHKDPRTIPEFQEEIRLLAKQHNKAGVVVNRLIQKPLNLPGVRPEYIYKLILAWPRLSSGKWDIESSRGRATWVRLMYRQLSPALSIPGAADYLNRIISIVYGQTYEKRSIRKVLQRNPL